MKDGGRGVWSSFFTTKPRDGRFTGSRSRGRGGKDARHDLMYRSTFPAAAAVVVCLFSRDVTGMRGSSFSVHVIMLLRLLLLLLPLVNPFQ